MPDLAAEVPDLIPARMLNEFVYCPRLFHLEWVQAEFADNDETVHGRFVHERADAGGGKLPEPSAVDDGLRARSVMLDAPLLGIIAKLDIVEAADGAVTPVERKRGKPRADGFVWEPEELQVVAQALVLRENGYRVDEGIISFPEARQRVSVPITDERVARLRAKLAELRTVAIGPPPPPLVDSPKCPRCSLVGICLPDESRLLTGPAVEEAPSAPRRLLTPADDAAPLYVQEQGARISRRGDRVEVIKKDEVLASVRALDVAHVAIYGNVSISAVALRKFIEESVTITHHTYGGWLVGVTTGPGHRNGELRVRQFATCADPEQSLAIAKTMVGGKIRNSRTLLRRNHPDRPSDALDDLVRFARRSAFAEDPDVLLGLEGIAARRYFDQFNGMLRGRHGIGGFTFEGRNRRPPRDPVNALLSFAYSLLVREVTTATIRVGLDPYVGVFHRPRYGRPALALDLAEEFRPIVGDSVVIGVINTGEIAPNDFIVRGGGFALTPPGRKAVIAAFERRMATEIQHPLFRYRVSYRRAIELQARILARVFTGEYATYRPFMTR